MGGAAGPEQCQAHDPWPLSALLWDEGMKPGPWLPLSFLKSAPRLALPLAEEHLTAQKGPVGQGTWDILRRQTQAFPLVHREGSGQLSHSWCGWVPGSHTGGRCSVPDQPGSLGTSLNMESSSGRKHSYYGATYAWAQTWLGQCTGLSSTFDSFSVASGADQSQPAGGYFRHREGFSRDSA